MIDYYQEEEERQIRKHRSFLREFFLRILDPEYGRLCKRSKDYIKKEICTSLGKDQFEFLKNHKDELFEDEQTKLMIPVIDEFIEHVEYYPDIELYIYDGVITILKLSTMIE